MKYEESVHVWKWFSKLELHFSLQTQVMLNKCLLRASSLTSLKVLTSSVRIISHSLIRCNRTNGIPISTI